MGRRIYIHQYSFYNLIIRDPSAADLVINALVRAKAAKMVHRFIEEDGIGLGHFSYNEVANIPSLPPSKFVAPLTAAISQLGFRPRDPVGRKRVVCLLAEGEEIVASCYDSGYFTFATSEKAAAVMFDDNQPISTLKREIASGSLADLTLIEGRNLVLKRTKHGFGEGKAKYYNDIFQRKANDDLSKIDKTQNEICDVVMVQIKEYAEINMYTRLPAAATLFVKERLGVIESLLRETLFGPEAS